MAQGFSDDIVAISDKALAEDHQCGRCIEKDSQLFLQIVNSTGQAVTSPRCARPSRWSTMATTFNHGCMNQVGEIERAGAWVHSCPESRPV